MKKRKIKKSVIKKGILLLFIIVIVIITKNTINTINYHKTDEYKLKTKGYSKEEIELILPKPNIVEYALNNDYNEHIDEFIKEKYFIDNNLERYINYKNKTNKSYKDVVSIVNVNADNKWYTNEKETDLSKENLMLVNKFNHLTKEYEPENVISISTRYAYDDNLATEEILNEYKKMHKQAEKENITLIISSGYRDYDEQKETYDYYKDVKGEEYANDYAAHPGNSEHQTGLAFDILTPSSNTSDFDETEAFEWLQKNAYKYGFILRYPKDKEEITGYKYEPWHYRYVGIETAKKIKEENITFDEYYAFYIENR